MSLIISTLSASAICLYAICCGRGYILTADRFLSFLNILPLGTSILTAVLIDENEPWTNNQIRYPAPLTGLFSRCSQPTPATMTHVDSFRLLTRYRCILADGTLVGAALACILWALLACVVCTARPSRPNTADGNTYNTAPAATKEPDWGRYIPEPPASLKSTSPTKSGLQPRPSILHQNPYERPLSSSFVVEYSYDGQPPHRRASKTYFSGGDDYHCGEPPISSPCTPYQPPWPASGPVLPMAPATEKVQILGPPYFPHNRYSMEWEHHHHSFASEHPVLPVFASPHNSDATTATQQLGAKFGSNNYADTLHRQDHQKRGDLAHNYQTPNEERNPMAYNQ